jgi:hypothetical protein
MALVRDAARQGYGLAKDTLVDLKKAEEHVKRGNAAKYEYEARDCNSECHFQCIIGNSYDLCMLMCRTGCEAGNALGRHLSL